MENILLTAFAALALTTAESPKPAPLPHPRSGRIVAAARTQTSEEKANLAVARRFFTEFIGQNKAATLDAVADPNIVVRTGLKPTGPIQGTAEYKQVFGGFYEAFALTKPLEILEMFASGDRVVTRFRATTTHTKPYYGMAPTGRPIVLIENHTMRLRNGKIVENIVSAENLEFEMYLAPLLTPMILK